MEDLWNSPDSFLGSQASSLLRFEAMRLSHGGPLEQSKLLPGIEASSLLRFEAKRLSMEDLWSSPDSFLGSRLPACSGWKRGAYRMEVRHPKPLKAVKNGALKVLSPQELERPNLSNLQTLKLIGYTLDGLSRKDLTSFKMKAADD